MIGLVVIGIQVLRFSFRNGFRPVNSGEECIDEEESNDILPVYASSERAGSVESTDSVTEPPPIYTERP
jgi:hypothetical protein